MRIAQVAPLAEAVPPRLYGGTERVIAWLTDALVEAGHDVTLFASGDSRTKATLVPIVPEARRDAHQDPAALADLFATVRAAADDFDILHFHTEFAHFGAFAGLEEKCVTTLHLRLDTAEAAAAVAAHPEMPLVAISDNQRGQLTGGRFLGTVPHGMPEGLVQPGTGSGDYLLFLGRLSPDKRPDRAIAVARQSGLPLRIAAKIDAADETYVAEQLADLLADPVVDHLGEVDDAGKAALLANARALVFPIDWPEPFGLVMIEAMAAGTPVIAWPSGAVPEVIEDGVTGRIVRSVEEAAEAVGEVARLSRTAIRARFEERFTSGRMGADYERLYRALIG